jgi:hypothetical protein
MAQQLTMEERYALDDWIGVIHHEIDIRSDQPNSRGVYTGNLQQALNGHTHFYIVINDEYRRSTP